MTIRSYTNHDYALLAEWWERRGMPVIPAECLPPHGIIVEDEDGMAGSIFLYRDANVPIGWMAWMQVRPGISCVRASKVLHHLTEATVELGKGLGLGLIQVQTERGSVNRFLLRRGWMNNHAGMLMYRFLES